MHEIRSNLSLPSPSTSVASDFDQRIVSACSPLSFLLLLLFFFRSPTLANFVSRPFASAARYSMPQAVAVAQQLPATRSGAPPLWLMMRKA